MLTFSDNAKISSAVDVVDEAGEVPAGVLLAQTLAFLGNTLLERMSCENAQGLDIDFWKMFPLCCGNERICNALDKLCMYASCCKDETCATAVSQVNSEFTRLFVGPPAPQASPWQTMYGDEETHIGMGKTAFEMKALLRKFGFSLRTVNSQYEDHIGIEILLASALIKQEVIDASVAGCAHRFIHQYPLTWIDALYERVNELFPCGYYAPVLQLAWGLLEMV